MRVRKRTPPTRSKKLRPAAGPADSPWPRIRFLGGAGTVTGSKFLLTYADERILVDCGLFQGLKELRLKNWDRFPIEPREISAVVLTHAHLDHCGYLPRLVKEGFRGKIYCTPPTADLCRLILLDAAHLQEEDARYLNRERLSKHRPALPLFDRKDALRALELIEARPFGKEFAVGKSFRVSFAYAGHILGAASPLVQVAGRRILFSGDLGRSNDRIMREPEAPAAADYLVIESTYGDRRHPATDADETLADVIRRTVRRKGTILVPAFAVGRAQAVIETIHRLKSEGRIPADLPVYLNSPMATEATDLLRKHCSSHRLSPKECTRIGRTVQYVRSVEESKALNSSETPSIIISASGMLSGGRILHHLLAFGGSRKNSVVLTGFQARGTRGRLLEDGARELTIFGRPQTIAAEVARLDNLSAHADARELMAWMEKMPNRPTRTFVVHGEEPASNALRDRIERSLGRDAVVPAQDQEFPLS